MTMVEIFKTNVRKAKVAKLLVKELSQRFTNHKINFDLTDCDKIRVSMVAGTGLAPVSVS
jgi:hypothetical protein